MPLLTVIVGVAATDTVLITVVVKQPLVAVPTTLTVVLTVGAMVDAVSEVFELENGDIQPSPAIGTKYRPEFIKGMMRFKDQFLMLLNIDKVFSAGEVEAIAELRQDVA